jgi:hypothetical protein
MPQPTVILSAMNQVRFASLLSTRSPTAVGRELGVDAVTVHRWRNGTRTPSNTVLLLAELLWRAPQDLAPGLPAAPEDTEG